MHRLCITTHITNRFANTKCELRSGMKNNSETVNCKNDKCDATQLCTNTLHTSELANNTHSGQEPLFLTTTLPHTHFSLLSAARIFVARDGLDQLLKIGVLESTVADKLHVVVLLHFARSVPSCRLIAMVGRHAPMETWGTLHGAWRGAWEQNTWHELQCHRN